jgi:hypothetical protein
MLVAGLVACACVPTIAHASQSAKLHVTFTPNRLGGPTTVAIRIQITTPSNQVPSPLTTLDLRYPSTLGITVSGLGIATCSKATLEALGPEGCPADSTMGHGSVLAEFAIDAEVLQEEVPIAIVRAPEQDGHFALLFYAVGGTPISAQIAFSALLLPAPHAGSIHIDIPPVPTLLGAPNVAVAELNATLGPRGLTYYERAHGRSTSYHPTGVLLPDQCPRGGFPFTASLTFEDGSHATVNTAVPCSRSRKPT